jgi:MtN3 and saliva related transmembrane protein
MQYIEIIGFLAGTFTTLALVPQVAKAWKTKLTRDISLAWILVLSTGIFLWMIYGILIGSRPLFLTNTVGLVMAITLLLLKIKYK